MNPVIDYSAKILQPGINLTIEGNHTSNITAIYDDEVVGIGLMATCRVNIQYSNIQWTLNNDNSVTVTGNVTACSYSREDKYSGTYTALGWDVWAEFDGQRVFSAVVYGDTAGTYQLMQTPRQFSITVPPQTEDYSAASIHFFSGPIGYSYTPDEFTVGLLIDNPNLPDYRPGKIYNGSNWMSHNRAAGFEKINTSASTTREMRTQDGGVGTGNPPTIYNSTYLNQRKIGQE